MSRKYEVVAVTGKYQDRDGNEKSRYMTIGAVIETRNGLMLKLEASPVGWDGWAYLNDPKPKDGQQQRQAPRQQPRADDGMGDMDSIPF